MHPSLLLHDHVGGRAPWFHMFRGGATNALGTMRGGASLSIPKHTQNMVVAQAFHLKTCGGTVWQLINQQGNRTRDTIQR